MTFLLNQALINQIGPHKFKLAGLCCVYAFLITLHILCIRVFDKKWQVDQPGSWHKLACAEMGQC